MRRWNKVRKVWAGVTFVSFLLAILGFICAYAIFPAVIDSRIFDHLNLWDDNSFGRRSFDSAPYTITRRHYIFALTNPLEFSNGEKPFLVEYGPFSFKESRYKSNVSTKDDGKHHIRYEQYHRYEFDQGSICPACSSEDKIFNPVNTPLIVLANVFKYNTPDSLGKRLLEELDEAIRLGYRDFVYLTTAAADKLLFKGIEPNSWLWFKQTYPDLMSILPESVVTNGDMFAFHKVDENLTLYLGSYQVSTGHTGALEDFNEIEMFGSKLSTLNSNLNNLSWWRPNGGYKSSNFCNKLQGTDGLQFHPHVRKYERLWIFRPENCRSNFLEFDEMQEVSELSVYRFVPSFEAVQVNTKDNLGFCMEVERQVDWNLCAKETSTGNENVSGGQSETLDITDCLNSPVYKGKCYDGLLHIERCMDYAPFVLSAPHFYGSPEILRMSVGGLSEPSLDRHGTFYDVEPETGTVIRFKRRWQMNLQIEPRVEVMNLSKLRKVLLPVYWIEESGEMNAKDIEHIKNVVTKPKKMFRIFQWVSVAFGFLGFTVGATYFIVWR